MTLTNITEKEIHTNGNPRIPDKLKIRTSKMLLWVAIGSMIMLFAGLTSALVIRQAEKDWVRFELPTEFILSTVLLVLSSGTIYWALRSAKRNKFSHVTFGLAATLVLGLAFACSQVSGWKALVAAGVFLTGSGSSVGGSYLYVLTGLHLAHLSGGVIALIVVLVRSLNNKYYYENTLGLELCSTYWHFLDILWIYLFLFLIFVR